jgi:hypothetical protein
MFADVFVEEFERQWDETAADAREVLEPVRQVWRDEDRVVDFDDEDRDEAV